MDGRRHSVGGIWLAGRLATSPKLLNEKIVRVQSTTGLRRLLRDCGAGSRGSGGRGNLPALVVVLLLLQLLPGRPSSRVSHEPECGRPP